MINFTPHTPPLEPPLGNQFTLGLEKNKADSSSTQPPLSESAKKWVPKIPTDGPLKQFLLISKSVPYCPILSRVTPCYGKLWYFSIWVCNLVYVYIIILQLC